jgi:phosphoglycolate/pyridoxal phosphate phosphatase family enzyme
MKERCFSLGFLLSSTASSYVFLNNSQYDDELMTVQFTPQIARKRMISSTKHLFFVIIIAVLYHSCEAFMKSPRAMKSMKIGVVIRSLSMNASPKKLTGGADSVLDKTDCFIFDCDGVIWRGDSLIDGIPATLEKLRAIGKKIFFVTNNSTKSRKGYLKKFTDLGLNVEPEEIFSSSFAAAVYLEQNPLDAGKKVYIIGQEGIGEELDLLNIPHFGGPEDSDKVIKLGPGVKVDHDRDVGAVIVGFDSQINYYKLQYAQLCINKNPGCYFIATNLDAVTHLTAEQEWVGNGAMVGAIKGCTGQEPIVVGKPSSLMVDYIVEKYGYPRDRICMVGDRLDTDIVFGLENGMQTILTLSGVTGEEKLLSAENKFMPKYYVDSIADFFVVSVSP